MKFKNTTRDQKIKSLDKDSKLLLIEGIILMLMSIAYYVVYFSITIMILILFSGMYIMLYSLIINLRKQILEMEERISRNM